MNKTSIICVLRDGYEYDALIDENEGTVERYQFYPEWRSMLEGIVPGDMFVLTTESRPGSIEARVDKIEYRESLRKLFDV